MSASPAGCKVLVTTKLPEAFPSGSSSSTADVGPSYQRLVVSPMDNVALWAQSLSGETVAVDMADGGLSGFLEDLAASGVGGSAGEHGGVRWKFTKVRTSIRSNGLSDLCDDIRAQGEATIRAARVDFQAPFNDLSNFYYPVFKVLHTHCLQLAKLRIPELNLRFLCRLAKILRPISHSAIIDQLFEGWDSLHRLPTASNSGSTALASYVKTMQERLPAEVQMVVCKNLQEGLFASLAVCSETLDWVEQNKPLVAAYPDFHRHMTHLNPRHMFLGLKMTSVLGESYLLEIGSDPNAEYSHTIPILDGAIGVQYALGVYGVRSMRILYKDGSSSPWTGDLLHVKLVRSAHTGHSLRSLEWTTDDGRVMGMACPGPPPSPTQTIGSWDIVYLEMIWDQAKVFPRQAMCYGIDTRRIDDYQLIRGHNRDRCARYLSLDMRDGRSHALTVFTTADGVCCVQIDGDERRTLGAPVEECCAVTCYLEPGETVQSLFVVTRERFDYDARAAPLPGPFLLAKTSRGRSLYYGPSIVSSERGMGAHISKIYHEPTHSVVGMFYDPLSPTPPIIQTFGVVVEPSNRRRAAAPSSSREWPSVSLPVLTRVDPVFDETEDLRKAFLTKGSLAGARSVRVQRAGVRCVGLLAEFHDRDIPVIVGQWDPSNAGAILLLHDAEKDGALETITFVFSDADPRERHVTDIIVNGRTMASPSHFKWDDLYKELSWFFTPQRDFLALWDGDVEDLEARGNFRSKRMQ